MNSLVTGKPAAEAIAIELKDEVEMLRAQGMAPHLTIIRVGAKPSDLAYERGAFSCLDSIGIKTDIVALSEKTPQSDLIECIKGLNDKTSTHGILLFRPFPHCYDEEILKQVIASEKDVDCFNPVNLVKIFEGDESGFAPCTPLAVMEMLKYYGISVNGKNVAVIGRSMVIGKPIAMMLLKENATVTICHSKTQNLPKIAAQADILVAAVGKARMVTPDYIKDGAVVIDVGINFDDDGKMCGDVDTEKCRSKCSLISAVPGGIGALTTTMLARNVIAACRRQQQRLRATS